MAKDLTALRPRELEAHFRELVRRTFGDTVENEATISASSGGNYLVALNVDGQHFGFSFKKKSANKIAKVIRALK